MRAKDLLPQQVEQEVAKYVAAVDWAGLQRFLETARLETDPHTPILTVLLEKVREQRKDDVAASYPAWVVGGEFSPEMDEEGVHPTLLRALIQMTPPYNFSETPDINTATEGATRKEAHSLFKILVNFLVQPLEVRKKQAHNKRKYGAFTYTEWNNLLSFAVETDCLTHDEQGFAPILLAAMARHSALTKHVIHRRQHSGSAPSQGRMSGLSDTWPLRLAIKQRSLDGKLNWAVILALLDAHVPLVRAREPERPTSPDRRVVSWQLCCDDEHNTLAHLMVLAPDYATFATIFRYVQAQWQTLAQRPDKVRSPLARAASPEAKRWHRVNKHGQTPLQMAEQRLENAGAPKEGVERQIYEAVVFATTGKVQPNPAMSPPPRTPQPLVPQLQLGVGPGHSPYSPSHPMHPEGTQETTSSSGSSSSHRPCCLRNAGSYGPGEGLISPSTTGERRPSTAGLEVTTVFGTNAPPSPLFSGTASGSSGYPDTSSGGSSGPSPAALPNAQTFASRTKPAYYPVQGTPDQVIRTPIAHKSPDASARTSNRGMPELTLPEPQGEKNTPVKKREMPFIWYPILSLQIILAAGAWVAYAIMPLAATSLTAVLITASALTCLSLLSLAVMRMRYFSHALPKSRQPGSAKRNERCLSNLSKNVRQRPHALALSPSVLSSSGLVPSHSRHSSRSDEGSQIAALVQTQSLFGRSLPIAAKAPASPRSPTPPPLRCGAGLSKRAPPPAFT